MFKVLVAKIKAKLTRKKNRFANEVRKVRVDKHEVILTLLSTALTFAAYALVFPFQPVSEMLIAAIVLNLLVSKPSKTFLKSTATAIAA